MQTNIKKQRTILQNSALHKFFELVAKKLNDAGLDMRFVLKPGVDIPWGKESVKNFLWKPVQNALLGKKSTKDLTTDEVDKVYEVLNRHFGEKFKIHQAFPSVESVRLKLEEKANEENRNTKIRSKTQ